MAPRWHILREPGELTLARTLPPRFDLAVETALPAADPLRIAQQVRQDMWRVLRRLRGFSPVVRVRSRAGGLLVTAGGRVDGAIPATARLRIADLLGNPGHRERWLRFARRKTRGPA